MRNILVWMERFQWNPEPYKCVNFSGWQARSDPVVSFNEINYTNLRNLYEFNKGKYDDSQWLSYDYNAEAIQTLKERLYK